MAREELINCLKPLTDVYGSRLTFEQKDFDQWYEIFKEYDGIGIQRAVELIIKNEKFAPVPATLIYYYNILDNERKELGRNIRNTYMNIRSVWEEEYDKETHKAFIDYVMKQPKDQRKDKLQNLKYAALSYAHDCDASGKPKMTIKEYVEHGNG